MGVFGDKHTKFKNGVEVEVCSNEPGYAGAWFEGVIVSHEGGAFKVQYDKFETDEGQPLIEELDYSHIRPRPPEINISNWAVGDNIEVLDKDCWWKGVVTKVLPHKFYCAHFPGYDTDMTCPHSKIRPRQEWQNGKWSLSLQARNWDTLNRGSAFEESTHELDEGFTYEEHPKVKKFRCSTFGRDINTGKLDSRRIFSDVSHMDTENKECSVSTTGSHTAFALAFQNERYKVLSKKESTYHAAKELNTHRKSKKQYEIGLADGHNVYTHQLELSAYRSVLQAFHAQGSLSWEREILLTNLRLELHISCHEHTFVLEQLSRCPLT